MNNRTSWILLGMVLAAVAGFILITGRSLPETVASHFSASGQANAWMPRSLYLGLMIAMSVGIPLLVLLLQVWVLRSPALLNLPNREAWLVPGQRDSTRDFLIAQGSNKQDPNR